LATVENKILQKTTQVLLWQVNLITVQKQDFTKHTCIFLRKREDYYA